MSNRHISVIYCRIEMTIDNDFYFVELLSYVTSGLADIKTLNFFLRISLLFYHGSSHNLVREIWVVHMTLRSY